MKAYSIAAPNWDTSSGGTRVMYGLYGWLLSKGQVAFLNQYIPGTDFVGIYPEIMQGNPFKAPHVVRYILQKPGMVLAIDDKGKGTPGPTEFDKSDDLYVFSRLYMKVPENRYLFLPIIDTHLFKNKKKLRTKKYFYVGKGINLFKHPKEAVELPRMQDQQKLADMLNECQTLYIYDPVTALSEIARLCGSEVVMLSPMEGFADKYEPGMNGVSFDPHKRVRLDYKEFRHHYERMKETFSLQLDNFINYTQAK